MKAATALEPISLLTLKYKIMVEYGNHSMFWLCENILKILLMIKIEGIHELYIEMLIDESVERNFRFVNIH